MNPNRGLARLGQPRSNGTTNLLFAITFLVFALVAQTAIDQQRGAVADQAAPGADEAPGSGAPHAHPALALRALVRPHF